MGDTLEELWISYNLLEKLKGIHVMKKLKVLYMSNNLVKEWGKNNMEYSLNTGNSATRVYYTPIWYSMKNDEKYRLALAYTSTILIIIMTCYELYIYFYMTGSSVGLLTPASAQTHALHCDVTTAMMSLGKRKFLTPL